MAVRDCYEVLGVSRTPRRSSARIEGLPTNGIRTAIRLQRQASVSKRSPRPTRFCRTQKSGLSTTSTDMTGSMPRRTKRPAFIRGPAVRKKVRIAFTMLTTIRMRWVPSLMCASSSSRPYTTITNMISANAIASGPRLRIDHPWSRSHQTSPTANASPIEPDMATAGL